MLRSGRCMATAVAFAERGAVVCNGGVASWWNGLSRTSMKPVVYGACGCAAHENVRKRVLIQAAGCNLGLLLRRLTGVGTPRSLQGRALSAICGLMGRLIDCWGRLTDSWGPNGDRRRSSAQSLIAKLPKYTDLANRLLPRADNVDAVNDTIEVGGGGGQN